MSDGKYRNEIIEFFKRHRGPVIYIGVAGALLTLTILSIYGFQSRNVIEVDPSYFFIRLYGGW
ncbi:MAG: hypothetical protein QW350_04770 [Candidatus Aenigmatarchaeota archaeon]|nr:hypothetical protein [Candidatus Aenigmarchaeota archaeon]